jgi:hypothetical protein
LASKNKNTLASLAIDFFPLSRIIPPPDPELFSDLERENLNYSPIWRVSEKIVHTPGSSHNRTVA